MIAYNIFHLCCSVYTKLSCAPNFVVCLHLERCWRSKKKYLKSLGTFLKYVRDVFSRNQSSCLLFVAQFSVFKQFFFNWGLDLILAFSLVEPPLAAISWSNYFLYDFVFSASGHWGSCTALWRSGLWPDRCCTDFFNIQGICCRFAAVHAIIILFHVSVSAKL